MSSYRKSSLLWDVWCVASIIGIWPRFIEPNTLVTNKHIITIPQLPKQLEGLRIVQFSDLHHSKRTSQRFLDKVYSRIQKLNPDLIVFTGDFICYSSLEKADNLQKFLSRFSAPLGCYAVLGNHDYEKPSFINEKGEYDATKNMKDSAITSGFKRLTRDIVLTKTFTTDALNNKLHEELIVLIAKTSFKLLNNETIQIDYKGTKFNLTGLGEYVFGQSKPTEAYKNYNKRYPGIILAHNPDAVPFLKDYPGNLILSGHTHGYQLNLPWMRDKFCVTENRDLVRGLIHYDKKWVYVNRGVGAVLPFRWFSLPEITLFTLRSENGIS